MMRKVVLFIAVSLDGYIADQNGGVEWLDGQDPNGQNKNSYASFIKNVDTVVMGWNTYEQVSMVLSPNHWVYEDLNSYVITHREMQSTSNIHFTSEISSRLIQRLRDQAGKDIWICGGASVVKQLMQDDLIDEYYLSIIPTLLGRGIRLFSDINVEQQLALVRTDHYNGIVEIVYKRRV